MVEDKDKRKVPKGSWSTIIKGGKEPKESFTGTEQKHQTAIKKRQTATEKDK